MSSLGKKTAFNKHVKFKNKTEVNSEELNTMVKKYVTADLKGGKKKHTRVFTMYINESRDED